uniref:Death domain-containing protein n=1 Tax=Amphimedon queenslandica TaxID=400682 RepID=A0A1X7SUU6_AMPQE
INSPPDIVDLTSLVAAKIQDKFYQFGTAIHLNDGFLKSLYDTYHDPIDRFIAVFNRWKDNDPDTYTWGTVIKVLKSDAIGAHAVAQDVMKHLTTNAEAAEHASN